MQKSVENLVKPLPPGKVLRDLQPTEKQQLIVLHEHAVMERKSSIQLAMGLLVVLLIMAMIFSFLLIWFLSLIAFMVAISRSYTTNRPDQSLALDIDAPVFAMEGSMVKVPVENMHLPTFSLANFQRLFWLFSPNWKTWLKPEFQQAIDVQGRRFSSLVSPVEIAAISQQYQDGQLLRLEFSPNAGVIWKYEAINQAGINPPAPPLHRG